jgi:hypothetical protein
MFTGRIRKVRMGGSFFVDYEKCRRSDNLLRKF